MNRFHALLATWNSFGVPQAINLTVPFAPDSLWPARFASGLLRGHCDSPDVLCVQELIGSSACGFFDGLASHAHRIRRGGLVFENHGLGVACRLALEHAEEIRFAARGTGSDALIHKGALHVRARLTRGPAIDVVTTHLQSGGAPEAAAARKLQVVELVAFVNRVADATRPLLVCGDFNIDGLDGARAEYVALAAAMKGAGLRDLDAVGLRATSDPTRNEVLREHEPGSKPERLDYMFLRVPQGDAFDLRVEAVKLLLDQPLSDIEHSWAATTGLGSRPFASDHFGLSVDLSYVPAG